MADVKSTTARIEDYELDDAKVQCEHDAPYPACLHGMSEEEIKKFGWRTTMKMDLIIMPALTIMYILNYLDRQVRLCCFLSMSRTDISFPQNIAASKLANIMEDLHMSVTQYNTCVSILFLGYSKLLRLEQTESTTDTRQSSCRSPLTSSCPRSDGQEYTSAQLWPYGVLCLHAQPLSTVSEVC